MIEKALGDHLVAHSELTDFLATYMESPAVFYAEAPDDSKPGWGAGPQYGRIVFDIDLQGDSERTMGGILAVDILCKKDEQYPEDIEPIVRRLIHGYFFSSGKFIVAAQWRDSKSFDEPERMVAGFTVFFDLLAFPILTTNGLDVISRLNEWTSQIEKLYVINHDELPTAAWKPGKGESAIYWRRLRVTPAAKIRDTYATIWRTDTIKGHIFSEDIATASAVADDLTIRLYTAKRLLKPGEAPIMVADRNTQDDGADPLRTGQLTVEATYGINRHRAATATFQNIKYE